MLAQLYLDSLKDKTSIKQIKSSLEQFNKQSRSGLGEDKKHKVLEKAYEQAMERINNQMPGFQVLGRKALAWITCAKRQLTTSELQHALGVEVGSTELDPDNLPEIEDVISACAGLVTFDKESNVIRLVHYTTQEYFDRTRQNWFPDAEADIKEVCITYLSFSVFESGCNQEDEYRAPLRSNPLYSYAALNWGHHARAAPDKQLTLDFLRNEAKAPAAYQELSCSKYYYFASRADGRMVSVHLAAHFGLTCLTCLLENGHDVDVKDGNGCTPLFCAIANGDEATVRLLLEHGADMEAEDKYCLTPISQAVLDGHEGIIKLLHEKGANLEAKDDNGQTPLLLALDEEHEAIVRLLLEKGADIEVKNWRGSKPLHLAAEDGHETFVRLLLEKGADTKATNGLKPLQLATIGRREAFVRLLFEKGVSTYNSEDCAERTQLQLAFKKKYKSIVELRERYSR